MILSTIDPSWASALNTALLIILAIVNGINARRTRRRVDLVSQHAIEAKRKCGAVRRAEDAAFTGDVAEHLPNDVTPLPEGRRFYDGSK